MTIRIEKALETTERYKKQNNLFLKAGFRKALAKEYRLEAVDIAFDSPEHTFWLPAYRKKTTLAHKLVIGAGFDVTSTTKPLPNSVFTAYMTALSTQLRALQIDQLAIRSQQLIPCQHDYADKVELSIELEESCEERFKQFSKSTRRNLRLPFKHGFHYVFAKKHQHLDEFYQVYQRCMHAIGTLPHSKQFFQSLWQDCHDDIGIFIGYMDDQPIATSLHFLTENEIYGAWGCVHPDYKKYSVFITMLWLILQYCEDSGRKTYNLGRTSTGSNAYHFKKRLANREHKIYHYQLTAGPAHTTQTAVYDAASWLIRHSPSPLMHTLSRTLLHRFY
ncbi:MAG: GNAT family N-acetyltransferase [Thiolinea sp.]